MPIENSALIDSGKMGIAQRFPRWHSRRLFHTRSESRIIYIFNEFHD